MAYNPDLDQIAVSVWTFSEFWIIDHSTTTAEAAGHTAAAGGKGGDLLYRWGNPRAYRAGTKADRKLFSPAQRALDSQGASRRGASAAVQQRPRAAGRELFVGGRAGAPRRFARAIRSQAGHGLRAGPARLELHRAEEDGLLFVFHFRRPAAVRTATRSSARAPTAPIFEVTPEKEIVWKYVNPVKAGTPLGTPPRPGQIMSSIAGEMLAISADQRKQLDEIQKDIDAHLDKLLTADQKKQAIASSSDPAANYGQRSQPGQVMDGAEQNRLKLTDDQKKDIVALQKAVDARFETVLTDGQRNQLKSVFSPTNAGAAIPTFNANIPQAGRLFTNEQQVTLKLSAEQRKRMTEIQKDVDAKLETLLTEEQKKQLQVMRQTPPPTTKVAGPPPGEGPRRRGGVASLPCVSLRR